MRHPGIGGFHQHASAIGELLTSLYAAGSANWRNGPDDPSPGAESIHGVMAQLNTRGLTHVISLDATQCRAICQSKCTLATLAKVAKDKGIKLSLPYAGTDCTVGAAILRGLIPHDRIDWVDVLTTSGMITRHTPNLLPVDAFIVAASVHLSD